MSNLIETQFNIIDLDIYKKRLRTFMAHFPEKKRIDFFTNFFTCQNPSFVFIFLK